MSDLRTAALSTVMRQRPCEHALADTSLGDGRTWAKCEDCGATFRQESWPRARQAAKEFDAAIDALRAALAADLTPDALDLHARIINIPAEGATLDWANTREAYLYGHRDARHAAAELALSYMSAPTAQPLTDVELRNRNPYRHSGGHASVWENGYREAERDHGIGGTHG